MAKTARRFVNVLSTVILALKAYQDIVIVNQGILVAIAYLHVLKDFLERTVIVSVVVQINKVVIQLLEVVTVLPALLDKIALIVSFEIDYKI